MIKDYATWHEKNEKDFHDFISKNVFFAFSDEQFKRGLEKFGIQENEISDKLCNYVGGGYMLKSAVKEHNKIVRKLQKAERKYLNNFKNLYSALLYEMYNHECGYTWNFTECLAPLGFTRKDLRKNRKLAKAFEQAKATIILRECD